MSTHTVDSMFADVILRTASSPENLATEGLRYLLERHSSIAWPAVHKYLGSLDFPLEEKLTFKTQAFSKEHAIPDLVGTDTQGNERLILEAKFWAGLTPNQPTTYLKRLNISAPGMVLVVAPFQRFDYLWEKLTAACADAQGIDLDSDARRKGEFSLVGVSGTHALALTSWRALLQVIKEQADLAKDFPLQADLRQLDGLTALMDGEAFLPLTPQDTAPAIGRRLSQYLDLVDDIVTDLVKNHDASKKGLSTGGGKGSYARYFRLRGLGMGLLFSASRWGRYGEPLWLMVAEITETGWVYSPALEDKIRQYLAAEPSRVRKGDGSTLVALQLPFGVEREDVVKDVSSFISALANKVGPVKVPSLESVPTLPKETI